MIGLVAAACGTRTTRAELTGFARFTLLSLTTLGSVSNLGAAAQPILPDSVPVLRYEADIVDAWSIRPASVVLGGIRAEGPFAFYNVAGVVVLANGEIVVGDGASSELRYFSEEGLFLRRVGGVGRGPGEINQLWDLFEDGDQIVAVAADGSASRFTGSGDFVERTAPPVSALGRRLRLSGFFSQGMALTYANESIGQVPDGRTLVHMRVVILNDGQPQFLFTYPKHFATRSGGRRPYYLAFGPSATLTTLGDVFCIGFPIRYNIDCFDYTGVPVYRIERDGWRVQPVTATDRDDFFAVNEAANPGPRGQAFREFLRENVQFADHYPAFGRFLSGRSGRELWVGPLTPEGRSPVLRPTPATSTTWSVYDSSNGAWLADIELPPRFRLMFVGERFISGILRDEHDVEAVAVFPLERG